MAQLIQYFPYDIDRGGNATLTADDYSYSGTSELVQETGGWKLRFLTSGVFTPKKNLVVDWFAVGGGSSGGSCCGGAYPSCGGGGGYTATVSNYNIVAGTSFTVTVGAGGTSIEGNDASDNAETAQHHTFHVGHNSYVLAERKSTNQFITAAGGGTQGYAGESSASYNSKTLYFPYGISGGSGGGGHHAAGGSDGSDGSTDTTFARGNTNHGGAGQGTTTREFGESTGTLYGGGGGGNGRGTNSTSVSNLANNAGAGGAGGGGRGGNHASQSNDYCATPENGEANTGGGGGGAASHRSVTFAGSSSGAGGSGIVIVRNHRS